MHDNNKMPGLALLGLEDTLILREYLSRYPRENCDYTITNLIAWGEIYRNHYLFFKERLVIFNPQFEYIFFPIGEYLPAAELADLVQSFRSYYPKAELILIPHEYVQTQPELNDYFEVREDRDWADYIYSVDKMVELSGKKLAKKKNLISQFVRAYPNYKVMQITADKLDVILQFTLKWKRERGADSSYLSTEIKAIENTLKHWNNLPVDGLIICLNSRIAGYSIFSPQSLDMVTEHFEKYDPDKKGAAQVTSWETARYLQGRYTWINREQDIGLMGLRQAKLSYVPDRFALFYGSRLR